MKTKLFAFAIASIAFFAVSTKTSAYDFDGIDLNAPQQEVTREISSKGYIYNPDLKCLVGNCQGTDIYLNLNLFDVTEEGRVGQLIVDVPSVDMKSAVVIFNVIYHQTASANGVTTYSVSHDGTTMNLSKTKEGIRLIYNTPYYKKK